MTLDDDGQGATVLLKGRRAAHLTMTYQRQKASGDYDDVHNIVRTPSGKERRVLVLTRLTLPNSG